MFGSIFKFLKVPIPPKPGDIFRDMDRERKKKGEFFNYVCNNGHKWKSYSAPTGTFCADRYGLQQTACPKCGSTICSATCVDKEGKIKWGAVHMDFK